MNISEPVLFLMGSRLRHLVTRVTDSDLGHLAPTHAAVLNWIAVVLLGLLVLRLGLRLGLRVSVRLSMRVV
jgi:hypothetical protein